jgi:hypothetical protein
VIGLSLAIQTLGAESPPADPPTHVPTAEEDGLYVLKRRSSVNLDLEMRSPFWPVGWSKADRKVQGPVEKPTFTLKPEYFRVSSILMGRRSLATINGRSFEEGERMTVVENGNRFVIEVRQIRDGGVVLGFEKQAVAIPLQRNEVGTKREPVTPTSQTQFEIRVGQNPAKP